MPPGGVGAAGRVAGVAPTHAVQFYDHEDFLAETVADFLGRGLHAGEPSLVIATEPHREQICARLRGLGIDVKGARESSQLTLLDARALLSRVLVDDWPQWERVRDEIGGVLDHCRRGRSMATPVHVHGEMVDLLCRDRRADAALRLEELWNDLANQQSFCLLCTYAMDNFGEGAHADDFVRVCRSHAHVHPTESYARITESAEQLRVVSLLQQRARAAESELQHRKGLELTLREA